MGPAFYLRVYEKSRQRLNVVRRHGSATFLILTGGMIHSLTPERSQTLQAITTTAWAEMKKGRTQNRFDVYCSKLQKHICTSIHEVERLCNTNVTVPSSRKTFVLWRIVIPSDQLFQRRLPLNWEKPLIIRQLKNKQTMCSCAIHYSLQIKQTGFKRLLYFLTRKNN